ncbi:hypothetical protein RFN28_26775 [Mesorhizobium sp. VK24D]|uniref:Core-binding (CB) domain-containing protein n=1 Tax=Mesorhizobium album TaxID=3072314 RepID=A0ABU4Y522_9HYPH|nr:hypothetical protein [Mesorhizobium sp. VK24D]MDX8482039.1 hypothetical protein [Mesorhizobium sp. VK24D]
MRSRAGWFIRDGSTFISACGGTGGRERAERRLASYIAEKYQPIRERGRDPTTIAIADAVGVYLTDVASGHAKPKETARRMVAVLNWFGDKMIGDIDGKICRDYAKAHGGGAAARRQLEDLRAALNHYHREGYVTSTPAIILPPKSAPRDRWLTRDEAAALLRAAWRMRQSWKGQPSDRRTGRHVARFILVALYTGTRSAAICGAAVRPTEQAMSISNAAFSIVVHLVASRRRNGSRRCACPIACLPIYGDGRSRRWRSRPGVAAKAQTSAE